MKSTTMLSKIAPNAHLALFVVLSSLAAPAAAETQITGISEEVIKEISQNASFNCSVENPDGYPVLWIKLDKYRMDRSTLSSDLTLIIRDNRFNVTYNKERNTYTLSISDLQESDTGYYECQIFVSVSNKSSAEVQLQIRRPPTISANITSLVKVTEGKPFKLYCAADGFPVPTITWKRENDLLLPSGGTVHNGANLEVASSHRDDRGVYVCLADNGVGERARGVARVNVEFVPLTTAVRPRVGQAPGYEAALECRIEAYPPPRVTWWRGEARLREHNITSETPNHEYVDALAIRDANEDSYGEYVCRAENAFGSTEARMQLFETTVPVCVNSCG